jgi:hypothetical protein
MKIGVAILAAQVGGDVIHCFRSDGVHLGIGVVTESTVAVPFASCRQEFIGLQSLSKEFEKNGTDKRGRRS